MHHSILACLSIGVTPLAIAVHGSGPFDRESNIELTGTITGVDFVNPRA